MLEDHSIAVVVPCFNEELLIDRVLSTMPEFVDRVFVIDDCSADRTTEIVQGYVDGDPARFNLLRHEKNLGVGAAIATGYEAARDEGFDITAVMAGDGQMDPDELKSICRPIVDENYDYVKGNRLFTGDAWSMIPHLRYLGNAMLSLLTKIASGYWHVADSQSGYTAINLRTLKLIDWRKMYPRYGQPNDLLVRLNLYNCRVKDVPIRPIYGIGEKSGIRPLRMIPKLSLLLLRLFFFRLTAKYVIRDFHPLVFFYFLGIPFSAIGVAIGVYLFVLRVAVGPVAATSALFSAFLLIAGLQLILFAMWMDMEYNKDLK